MTDSALRTSLGRLASLRGVQAAVLANRDGLIVSSSTADGQDQDLLAGAAAAIFGTLERSVGQVNLGQVVDSIVETSSHSLQMMAAGDLVLLVVADKRMSVAEIRREMRRLAGDLARLGLA